jgi:hypothetical protein
VIVAAQFLYKPAYPEAMDPFPPVSEAPVRSASTSQTDLHPAYVIIFDEWSYRRTFANRAVRPELVHLAALAGQSAVFHRAVSPANMTEYSIPRMLFGVDWKVSLGVKGYGFEVDGRFSDGWQHPSIFRSASAMGYRTIMIGAAFPFRLLLGDQVKICRAHCWLEGTRSGNPLLQGAVDLYDAAGYWADPWTPFLLRKSGPDRSALLRASWGYDGLHSDLLEIINHQPANTFAVVHFPTPHAPYVMDENGRPCPRGEAIWTYCKDEMHLKGYERNLRYLDHLVGEIVEGLRQRDLFEEALLIVTSDHDWRADPDHHPKWAEQEYREVPLLVKMPGQRNALAIDEPFQTKRLGRLIQFALGPDGKPEGMPSLVHSLQDSEAGRRAAGLAARVEPAP